MTCNPISWVLGWLGSECMMQMKRWFHSRTICSQPFKCLCIQLADLSSAVSSPSIDKGLLLDYGSELSTFSELEISPNGAKFSPFSLNTTLFWHKMRKTISHVINLFNVGIKDCTSAIMYVCWGVFITSHNGWYSVCTSAQCNTNIDQVQLLNVFNIIQFNFIYMANSHKTLLPYIIYNGAMNTIVYMLECIYWAKKL